MNRPLSFAAELAILAGLALAAAAVANLIGPPERRLAWVRDYPDALSVPRKSSPAAKPAPAPAAPAPSAAATPGTPPATKAPVDADASGPAPAPREAKPAAARKGPPPKTTGPTPASPGEFAPHPDKPWKEISPEEARALFDRGAVFIDARRSSVYRDGHIARARPMAVWEADADEKIKAFYEEGHDSNAPLVVYCSGGDCEDSHQLAQKLYGAGFDAVFVYKDGIPDWQRRGWPVEKGEGK